MTEIGSSPRASVSRVSAGGVNIHYRQVGSGPPAVLIHGLTGTLADWQMRIVPMLSGRFTVVTYDLPPERREAELARLFSMGLKLTAQVIREDYSVLEDPSFSTGIVDGTLRVDRLTPARAGIVSLIVAQSAAMEYYERIVERLSTRTETFVERLERRGTVSLRTRPLHRFIGEAISTRSEVLSVLHLLDKPDAAWDDPEMDRIYGDLRAEFDLVDRYRALEVKLRGVQEALELLAEVARDERVLLLEVIVVILILLEVVMPTLGYR